MIAQKLPSDIATQATILGASAITPVSAGSSSGTEILAVQSIDTLWTNTGGATRTISIAKPDDADTSYMRDAAGFNDTTAFSVTDSALSGVTIPSVTARIRARIESGTDSSAQFQMSDNGIAWSATFTPAMTTAYVDAPLTLTTAPSGGAWTVAKVNSLQLRAIGGDFGGGIRLTTLTVEVAWTIP